MKKVLAVLLAVTIMLPMTMPVIATEITTETEMETEVETEVETEAESEVETEVETEAESEVETEVETEINSEVYMSDTIFFNTGNCEWKITDENGNGDDYFAEDGSYTIYIPEANPFFPYEVQFTHNGNVTTEWFMTPDDSVTIGNHTFYVVGQFDNETVTQMTFNVGGDTVIVYPEKKVFTNDGGMQTYSLLPLEEKYLTVDLSSYTPVELTMVSVDSIFTGENALENTDYLMWTRTYEDDFKVNTTGDKLNFSYGVYYNSYQSWQMIVGDDDQLAADNTRYILNVNVTPAEEWLIPTAYIQGEDGSRTPITNLRNSYNDSYMDGLSRMYFYFESDEMDSPQNLYLSYTVNSDKYATPNYASLKVYEGAYTNPEEAIVATDITPQVMNADMSQKGAGCLLELYKTKDITFVTFDAAGNVTGCLPVKWIAYSLSNSFYFSMYDETEDGIKYISDTEQYFEENSKVNYTFKLYKEYASDQEYGLTAYFYVLGEYSNDLITAAYVGNYNSIAEAVAVGAEDIKDQLFNGYYGEGYEDIFNEGVDFTFFIGEDGSETQEIYYYNIKTETGENPSERDDNLSSSVSINFYGLRDKDGGYIDCYVVDEREDSYAEYNYLTILVPAGVDLTNIAPSFSASYNAKVYAAGSSTPEESGVSLHDFSNGPVQYTVSAEDGKTSKNYWLNVISATEGVAELYINSLFDDSANVREENGIVYATREVMLNAYHDNIHDILVANVGTEALEALKVTLDSDVVALDRYWTLSGDYDLYGLVSLYDNTSYGELANLAKIRLTTKDGVEIGTEIEGTLTIKSGEKVLVVLELTGLIGDPIITTEDIPAAVKYVPYGTMIQNNNKYSWNSVSYKLLGGTLPAGMELKENGEIYGVPTETGEFAFSVMMDNSYSYFSDDTVDYILVVSENTTENVDDATDEGYELSARITDLDTTTAESQTLVSEGNYAEFVGVYIDGIKLVEGEDYTSEEGSTRITISSQTLAETGDSTQNTHTIGIEFRTADTGSLKRAAQNYEIVGSNTDDSEAGDSNTGGSNTGDSNTGGSNAGNSNTGGSDVENSNIGGSNAGDSNIGSSNISDSNVGAFYAGSMNYGIGGTITQTVEHYVAGPKEATSYNVSAGDTLWSISVKYYGTGNYWKHIYETNKDVISDPNKIFVGQKISLTPVIGTSSKENNDNDNFVSDEGTYMIVSGDNLWKIAKKVYGKGWKWRQIYDANKAVIVDPARIYVGQVIQIPTE